MKELLLSFRCSYCARMQVAKIETIQMYHQLVMGSEELGGLESPAVPLICVECMGGPPRPDLMAIEGPILGVTPSA